MGCCSLEVNIVVASACANHDLQVLCCVENLGSDFVGTYDERVCVLDCVKKLSLLCVLFQKSKLKTCSFNLFLNALDCNWCERLFCCY